MTTNQLNETTFAGEESKVMPYNATFDEEKNATIDSTQLRNEAVYYSTDGH